MLAFILISLLVSSVFGGFGFGPCKSMPEIHNFSLSQVDISMFLSFQLRLLVIECLLRWLEIGTFSLKFQ